MVRNESVSVRDRLVCAYASVSNVGNAKKTLMDLSSLVSGLCEHRKNANMSRIYYINCKEEELRLRSENPAAVWCEAGCVKHSTTS